MDIINKTNKPLSIPLPGGKKLFLGPRKTGQITPKALEHPPVAKQPSRARAGVAHFPAGNRQRNTVHLSSCPDADCHRRASTPRQKPCTFIPPNQEKVSTVGCVLARTRPFVSTVVAWVQAPTLLLKCCRLKHPNHEKVGNISVTSTMETPYEYAGSSECIRSTGMSQGASRRVSRVAATS